MLILPVALAVGALGLLARGRRRVVLTLAVAAPILSVLALAAQYLPSGLESCTASTSGPMVCRSLPAVYAWAGPVPYLIAIELSEGPQARTPGKALDLGCGTGTNTMYMAQHGWDVTGIDFVATAIAAARKKMQAANVAPRLIQGDVTRLKELGLGAGYSLVFDLGCLHSIPEVRRDAYAAGVNEVAVPGADFLVWGFYAKPNFFVNAKLAQDELEQLFGKSWDMVRACGGEQPDRFPGRWYHLRRKS